MVRRAPLAFLLLGVTAVMAASCNEPDVGTASLGVGMYPRTAFSGYNPNATFSVLFSTNAADAVWSVADPNLATIEPTTPPNVSGVDINDLHYVKLTMRAAGNTTVRVTAQGTSVTAQLTVKAYTDEQLALGKARYEDASTDATRPPCAGCHQKPGGVDHSPLKMAGFDDPTILGVIQNATYPANGTGTSATGAYSPRGPLAFTGHKWNLTDAEKDGIMSHLRSLPLGTVAADPVDAGRD